MARNEIVDDVLCAGIGCDIVANRSVLRDRDSWIRGLKPTNFVREI